MVETTKEIEEESPEEIWKKYKRTIFFYPYNTYQQGIEIPLVMATLRILAGNETKSPFGQQLYITVLPNDPLWSIYR
jgi:hypothetical protein